MLRHIHFGEGFVYLSAPECMFCSPFGSTQIFAFKSAPTELRSVKVEYFTVLATKHKSL